MNKSIIELDYCHGCQQIICQGELENFEGVYGCIQCQSDGKIEIIELDENFYRFKEEKND